MKRRDFFRSLAPEKPSKPEEPVPQLTVSRKAMGGEFEITFDNTLHPDGTEYAMEALSEITRLETLLSIFRADSQISYINKVAAYSPVPLEDELYGILSLAQRLSEETGGAVDITSTPLWQLWGFASRHPKVPQDEEICNVLENVGSRFIELDEKERTIRFTKSGVSISLGALGKGYALDVAAKKLEENGVENFQFHGGMSSVLTRGDFRKGGERRGWTLGIAHPLQPGKRIAEVTLFNRSLGTSGSQKQFFLTGGRRYSHIIDPRSGYPAEKALLVSVLAESALLADALSTALFVMDREQARLYCQTHPEIAAFLIYATEKAPGCEIVHYGFTNETLALL